MSAVLGAARAERKHQSGSRQQRKWMWKRCYIQCDWLSSEKQNPAPWLLPVPRNNNAMSRISKEMRGERERRLCFFFFYTRQSCEAMKPPIDKRGLIRGSSGERKVSEVRPHNSRRIHRLLAAKTEPRFLYFSFPFHPLTADPSLFCLLLPVLRLLPLLLSRAAEGFAPSELRCYLNYANTEKKKMQSCILFVNFLAGENIYIYFS